MIFYPSFTGVVSVVYRGSGVTVQKEAKYSLRLEPRLTIFSFQDFMGTFPMPSTSKSTFLHLRRTNTKMARPSTLRPGQRLAMFHRLQHPHMNHPSCPPMSHHLISKYPPPHYPPITLQLLSHPTILLAQTPPTHPRPCPHPSPPTDRPQSFGLPTQTTSLHPLAL